MKRVSKTDLSKALGTAMVTAKLELIRGENFDCFVSQSAITAEGKADALCLKLYKQFLDPSLHIFWGALPAHVEIDGLDGHYFYVFRAKMTPGEIARAANVFGGFRSTASGLRLVAELAGDVDDPHFIARMKLIDPTRDPYVVQARLVNGPTTSKLSRFIDSVAKSFPMRVFFADSCGFAAKLQQPITRSEAKELAQRIDKHNPDVGASLDMIDLLYSKRIFRLWKD